MTDQRAEWFAFHGIAVPARDPETPLTMIAVITGNILLDCYRRAEIDRLDFLTDHMTKHPGQPSKYSETKRRENWEIFARASFLLGHELGQYEQPVQGLLL